MARDQADWQADHAELAADLDRDAGAARMGPMAPVAWSFDAARFDPPILLTGSEFDGAAYVVVPGARAGSGSGNADILFRWEPPHSYYLTQIDTWSWRDDLAGRLPPGLEILQGLRFDWPEMLAFTPLWQDGDGACCGTGGTAILSFQIEGARLSLVDVTVRDALIDTAASTPDDVFAFAGRWIGCAHGGGEEPYDAERRAETARAVAELRCAALWSDRAALRLKYADDTRVLGLIARVDAGEPQGRSGDQVLSDSVAHNASGRFGQAKRGCLAKVIFFG